MRAAVSAALNGELALLSAFPELRSFWGRLNGERHVRVSLDMGMDEVTVT